MTLSIGGGIVLGQYLPTGSWLHRLDPRQKLLAALTWFIVALLGSRLLGMAAGALILVLMLLSARIPPRYALAPVRRSLPFLLLLAALQALVMAVDRESGVIFEWGILVLTWSGVHAALLLLIRYALLIWLIGAITLTTTTSQVMRGAEALLRPLQRIGLPAHELALIIEITLRSVPLLAQEADRLVKAQASRGADFGAGSGGVIRRVRRVVPLVVPLLVGALERAERLAIAMDARGYVGGEGRTHRVVLRANLTDWLFLAASIGAAAIILVI
jgi:energy-coupling factor transport system permease protein